MPQQFKRQKDTGLSFSSTINESIKRLNVRERIIFVLSLASLSLGLLGVIHVGSQELLLEKAPAHRGSYSETVVGSVRFVNPVLGLTQAEGDISQLVYSGLVRKRNYMEYVPDLAQSVSVDDSGTVYTFVLKDNLFFHDGAPVSSDDVLFTYETIKNPVVRSPLFHLWHNVEVTAQDSTTVTFTLSEPRSDFLEHAQIGILPQHLWGNLSPSEIAFSPLNIRPVGTGPYKIASVEGLDNESSSSTYKLKAFSKFALGEPHIQSIDIGIVSDIDSSSEDSIYLTRPVDMKDPAAGIMSGEIFALFINQRNVNGKDASLPLKETQQVLAELSFSNLLEGTLEVLDNNSVIPDKQPDNITDPQSVAIKDIDQEPLRLLTGNAEHLILTSNAIASTIENRLGISVQVIITESNELIEEVVPNRDYDLLVFGYNLPHPHGLSRFWHSNQEKAPGLNFSGWANPKTNSLLEEAQKTQPGTPESFEAFMELETQLENAPVIPLYQIVHSYKTPQDLTVITPDIISNPKERFLLVHQWYKHLRYVWPF